MAVRFLPLALVVCLAVPASAQRIRSEAGDRARAEGLFVRALVQHAMDADSVAARLLDEALLLAPGAAALHDAAAEVAAARGRTADALDHAQRAVAAAPGEPAYAIRQARLLAQAGQAQAAVRSLEGLRAAAPDRADVLEALADLHAAQGDADAERDALLALVRLDGTAAYRLRLAALARQHGDADGARDHLTAARRLAPHDPAVRRALDALAPATPAPATPRSTETTGSRTPADLAAAGEAALRDARPAEAANLLLAAVAADPRLLDAWSLALDALVQARDPRAATVADDATLLFPSVPAVLASAADAYRSAGRPADAHRVAQDGLDALDLVPDTPDADALRGRLRAHVDG